MKQQEETLKRGRLIILIPLVEKVRSFFNLKKLETIKNFISNSAVFEIYYNLK